MKNLVLKFATGGGDINDKSTRNRCGERAGLFGIFCNLILCVIKIAAGALAGSISIIADGLNNLSDMGSSVITMIGFKIAGKPADKDHPYGHGRMEYMSAFIVAMLILLVGIELFKESASALFAGEAAPRYGIISVVILAISVVIKFFMYLFNRTLGQAINSEALIATAQDCINDSITTLAILISVGVSTVFKFSFNLDAVMGIGISLFILYSGFNTARDTTNVILGMPPEKETIEQLKECIFSFQIFEGIHDLIVHNYGPNRTFASVHVEVDKDIDVVYCHEKIDLCEKVVKEKCGIELVIHMDPIETNNEEINNAKAMIAASLADINEKLTLHDFRMTPHSKGRTNFIFDVVLPAELKMSESELREKIDKIAKDINPTYYCVITFENDYTGA